MLLTLTPHDSQVEKPVQFNKEINDVMDLMLKKTGYKLKEAYTKKIMRENKECNMNDAFQTIVSTLIQVCVML